MKCPKCGLNDTIHKQGKETYECYNCGHLFIYKPLS